MVIRLKDKELQAALDQVSGSSRGFSDALESISVIGPTGAYVKFGTNGQYRMTVYTDDVEPIPVYNPNDWNSYPDVVPPTDREFRVEFYHTEGEGTPEFKRQCLCKSYGQWDGRQWRINATEDVTEANEILFRPWGS